MTSPRPALKPRPRSPEQPASEADASGGGASATDERARVLQEHAAAARRPPVKRQRRMARSESGEAAAAGLAAQECREDELASTAASTPAGSVGATDDKENVVVVDSEEKQMDGAPEGDLFLVNVLSSDEFQPSADLEQELAQLDEMLALLKGQERGDDDVSWGAQYRAVDSVRRLAIHHTQEIQQRLARALSLLVLPSVSSLRSAMSRNAVLCVEDLIRALPTDISEHFDTIVPLLIQRACNEKQFIRDAAKEVLDTTVQVVSNASLLETLLQASGDKNPQAVSVAGVYATKCIQSMDKDHLKTFVTETHQIFLEEMAAFLNCKVVECKAHARRALQYTRKTIGDTTFVALAKAQLTGGAQFDVLRASEERKKPAGPKGRPSIRERMMQMKKAKGLPAGGNSGDDVPVVVVAAPTPSAPAALSASSADAASSL